MRNVLAVIGQKRNLSSQVKPYSFDMELVMGVSQYVSIGALLYGCIIIYRFWHHSELATKFEGKMHIILWTLGPPIWFFAEYYYLKDISGYDASRLADVKIWQDLATKFWAGILAVMLFLSKVGK
jgi:hypothetical protein